MSGHGLPATQELATLAPTRHLLSNMAVYTAWGDTEKNLSSRSSQISSVSCRRDRPRGQADFGILGGLSRLPNAQVSLWSSKPWVQMCPLTGTIRLLNWFQGFQALRNLHTFECLQLLPGELLHILQGSTFTAPDPPTLRRALDQPWVLHSDHNGVYPTLSPPQHAC